MIETGKIINGDCIEVMSTLPECSVDLIVTSPPYGVGIEYDVHDDDMLVDEYFKFTEDWMTQAFRVLKDDGRLIFCEHGLAPDKKISKWQNRIDPFWGKIAGGCHLNRDIQKLRATRK